jgi:NADH-quinone oxidoreductase subunit J
MPLGLFIFLAALALISALGVILQRNPVHCLLALVMVLLDFAVLYIALGAVTVGFLQAIVYVGAIMILFLFVIWLLNLRAEARSEGNLALKFFGALGASALTAELWMFVAQSRRTGGLTERPPQFGSIASLAQAIFSQYLVAFEVTSVLLLVAVVGAVALARRPTPSSGAAAEFSAESAEARRAGGMR